MLVLVFYLGETMYLIKYTAVREISPVVVLNQVPHTPEYFAGFFNYRGLLVPVIDLCHLVHGQACRMRLSSRIILVDYVDEKQQPQVLGLLAERVTEAVRKPLDAFIKPPLNFDETPYLGEVIMEDKQMIQCIDLDALAENFQFLHQLHDNHTPSETTGKPS
ncbi:chemotaxis protein CheW [Candidatus Venteria ishoeyi]|uniref:Purine-binding chemotaxis protein n=1 Tax=Candidatus Venteria ishoeyi TaxID=1899563 RepID=A0A1H6FIR7_9GAMM|nr:chemotaxis protein CheW [Candidatus Venteria ishoeyi]MDM8546760.1 chemotaxis protein CheW [Candidatus Venteria ishoeyi]SEH09130.1 purine-binding chemotaxis protein [Candidatus Venteria ishoeyi]SEH09259.1 purine-binding chemotaxis protein [Candidatus Venteria ishoeyi]